MTGRGMEPTAQQVISGFTRFEALIISEIGEQSFHGRLSKAVDHAISPGRLFRDCPDRLFWYIVLFRALAVEDFVIYNMHEGARIVPVLANIGISIDDIGAIDGIGGKIKELCGNAVEDIDTILFEILVAAMYKRRNCDVRFVDRDPTRKTPDLRIESDGKVKFVECKKLQRANGYAYMEIDAWYSVADAVADLVKKHRLQGWFDFVFTNEIVGLNPRNVLRKVRRKLGRIARASRPFCVARSRSFRIRFTPISQSLCGVELDPLRNVAGPSFIEYLTGQYDIGKGYKVIGEFDLENGPFVSLVNFAAIFSWSVTSYKAIVKKAQHVKKRLVDAMRQVSEAELSAIHILVEECSGSPVYMARLHKNLKTIFETSPGEGYSGSLYLHVVKYLVPLNMSYDVEETILKFGYGGVEPEAVNNCWFHWESQTTGIGTLYDDY